MLNKKLQSLLEELTSKGEVAKKDNEATKKNQPELYKVQLGNKDVYTKDSHKEVEEIKEVIVESEFYSKEDLERLFEKIQLDTEKYTFDYLAEQLGFELLDEEELTSKGDIAHKDNEATDEGNAETSKPDTDNEDIYSSDEHNEDEEVEEVVVEDEIYSEDDLVQIFEALELDTEKFTFDYLAEQLGFELLDEFSEEEIISENQISMLENLEIYNNIESLSLDEFIEKINEMSYEELVVTENIIEQAENFMSLNEGIFRGNMEGKLKAANKTNKANFKAAKKSLVKDGKVKAKQAYKAGKKELKANIAKASKTGDYNELANLGQQRIADRKKYKLNKKGAVQKIKNDVARKKIASDTAYKAAKQRNRKETSLVSRATAGVRPVMKKAVNAVKGAFKAKPGMSIDTARELIYKNTGKTGGSSTGSKAKESNQQKSSSKKSTK
jgi:hypothetical protein